MPKIFRILLPVFLVLFSPAVRATDEFVLYCTDELAVGFFYEDGRWQSGNFGLERFTIKVEDGWKRIIHEKESFSCYTSSFQGFKPILCKNDLPYDTSTFNIDGKTLRYVFTNAKPTAYASPLKSDTDFFSAGKCEKF